jgi:hypothetical protein
MPTHWRARRDPLYSEEALAWHEAGHVVVAYEFGWWLRRGGVRVGAWAHARHRRHAGAGTVLARCCVSLAGLVAEQRFHDQQSWHFAGDVLKEIRDIRAGVNESISLDPWDLRAVAAALLDDDPAITLKEARRAVVYCQKHTEGILAKPRVWAGAERIATALLRRGHLSPRAVKQILGESFFQRGQGYPAAVVVREDLLTG